jgi:hypothetical protein
MMAKLDELEHHPLSRLRHAVSAGEPLNPEVIAPGVISFTIGATTAPGTRPPNLL